MGAGRLQVTLPRGVPVTLHISLGLGDIQLPGDAPDDVDLSAGDRQRTVTLPAEGLKKGEKPRGSLELDLKVGAGQVDVQPYAPATPPTAPTAPSAPSPPSVPPAPTGRSSEAPKAPAAGAQALVAPSHRISEGALS